MGHLRNLINWYFSKRTLPYWCILLLDSLFVFISGFVSYWFFHRGSGLVADFAPLFHTMILYVAVSFIGFFTFHTYSGIIRYSSFIDLQKVAMANILSAAIYMVVNHFIGKAGGEFFVAVRDIEILIILCLATLLMWAMRVFVKLIYDLGYRADNAMNVLIYGAQSGGVGIAKSIRNEKPAKFTLKGFISHDEKLSFSRLLGEKVYPVNDKLTKILVNNNIGAVLISPKRIEKFRNDEYLQDLIINAGVKIFMEPEAEEWKPGDKASTRLKEVSISDLLPREQINVDLTSIGEMLKGKTILITGSAGSIGSEIVRQIATFSPAALVLVDQAETPQHDIRLMMAKEFPTIKAETIVTSITNADRMDLIFRSFRPDYVFHAAAYKHVPMMEDNPSEAVHNNVLGTKIIADLSVKYDVKKFVMVSTDKAVNPTNVMGCSKRICEIYVQSLNKAEEEGLVEGKTQFVTTRFGNVLGSNGSVIPIFERQIKEGGPVTVTDPNIIRFFMLIPEACKLVLEAGTKGNGGEIFVFDMGKPVKIAELAKRMIKLSGAQGVEIKYTGLRDGEKLYEEVLSEKETTKESFHEKIRIASVREYDFNYVKSELEELFETAQSYDCMKTVAKMKEIVPEFISNHSVYSVLDQRA
ncbi:MAG: polysaccharide biosynthesis protein [Bacteroidales bacterium]|nr:polysaccharide biosynthesis protein [Bacteroidales bacterium]MBQ9173399.1 polysaccharide biosynthesis protein [Bacteroidales bacterium]MBQ9711666.1 polysaccharide biosynthesis protein [Bacteroidales bacterium]